MYICVCTCLCVCVCVFMFNHPFMFKLSGSLCFQHISSKLHQSGFSFSCSAWQSLNGLVESIYGYYYYGYICTCFYHLFFPFSLHSTIPVSLFSFSCPFQNWVFSWLFLFTFLSTDFYCFVTVRRLVNLASSLKVTGLTLLPKQHRPLASKHLLLVRIDRQVSQVCPFVTPPEETPVTPRSIGFVWPPQLALYYLLFLLRPSVTPSFPFFLKVYSKHIL